MAAATPARLDEAAITPAADEAVVRPAILAVLDKGYFSEAAVAAMEGEGFDPYIATERQRHHAAAPGSAPSRPGHPERPALRSEDGTPEPPRHPRPKERMRAKLGTESGRAVDARRQTIVEPVFGQIKEARGFRRFLLRGLKKIRGEWRLLCLTHNLLKIWRYGKIIFRGSCGALIN